MVITDLFLVAPCLSAVVKSTIRLQGAPKKVNPLSHVRKDNLHPLRGVSMRKSPIADGSPLVHPTSAACVDKQPREITPS